MHRAMLLMGMVCVSIDIAGAQLASEYDGTPKPLRERLKRKWQDGASDSEKAGKLPKVNRNGSRVVAQPQSQQSNIMHTLLTIPRFNTELDDQSRWHELDLELGFAWVSSIQERMRAGQDITSEESAMLKTILSHLPLRVVHLATLKLHCLLEFEARYKEWVAQNGSLCGMSPAAVLTSVGDVSHKSVLQVAAEAQFQAGEGGSVSSEESGESTES